LIDKSFIELIYLLAMRFAGSLRRVTAFCKTRSTFAPMSPAGTVTFSCRRDRFIHPVTDAAHFGDR
jgi:hypothetical protein